MGKKKQEREKGEIDQAVGTRDEFVLSLRTRIFPHFISSKLSRKIETNETGSFW
jgi:hypothetical protein